MVCFSYLGVLHWEEGGRSVDSKALFFLDGWCCPHHYSWPITWIITNLSLENSQYLIPHEIGILSILSIFSPAENHKLVYILFLFIYSFGCALWHVGS